jgi:hypothetical protein
LRGRRFVAIMFYNTLVAKTSKKVGLRSNKTGLSSDKHE